MTWVRVQLGREVDKFKSGAVDDEVVYWRINSIKLSSCRRLVGPPPTALFANAKQRVWRLLVNRDQWSTVDDPVGDALGY